MQPQITTQQFNSSLALQRIKTIDLTPKVVLIIDTELPINIASEKETIERFIEAQFKDELNPNFDSEKWIEEEPYECEEYGLILSLSGRISSTANIHDGFDYDVEICFCEAHSVDDGRTVMVVGLIE